MKNSWSPGCRSRSATSPTSCGPAGSCSSPAASPPTAQGRVVGGSDVVAQTRQVHENIKRCLAAAGATFADICKVTVFLRDIDDREKVNTVRKEYFGAHRPASTLVEISRLVRDDYLVEIEATAVHPRAPRRRRPRAQGQDAAPPGPARGGSSADGPPARRRRVSRARPAGLRAEQAVVQLRLRAAAPP